MRHITTTVTLLQKPYLIDDVSLEETDIFIKRNFSIQKKGMSLSHGFSWSSLRSYRFDRVTARLEILQRGQLSLTLAGQYLLSSAGASKMPPLFSSSLSSCYIVFIGLLSSVITLFIQSSPPCKVNTVPIPPLQVQKLSLADVHVTCPQIQQLADSRPRSLRPKARASSW